MKYLLPIAIILSIVIIAFCIFTMLPSQEAVPPIQEQKVLHLLWCPENNWEGFEEFLKLYEEKTGYKVEIQYFPAVEYDTVLRIKMQSGDGPDIFRTENTSVTENIWPAEWYYDLSDRDWTGRLTPAGREAISLKNGMIAQVPLTAISARGLLYNRDVLLASGVETLPKTWDEFIVTCQRVKAAGYLPVNIQAASDNEFGTLQFLTSAWQGIYEAYGETGSADLMNQVTENKLRYSQIPQIRQGVEQLLELKKLDLINDDYLATTMEVTARRITNGECAFVVGGDWVLAAAPESLQNANLGMMPLPLGDMQNYLVATSGIGIAVNANSPELEAALEFIDLWCSAQWQEENQLYNPGISIFSDVESNKRSYSDDITFWTEQDRCKGIVVNSSGVFPEMDCRVLMQPLLEGTLSVDDFLKELDRLTDVNAKNLGLTQ